MLMTRNGAYPAKSSVGHAEDRSVRLAYIARLLPILIDTLLVLWLIGLTPHRDACISSYVQGTLVPGLIYLPSSSNLIDIHDR